MSQMDLKTTTIDDVEYSMTMLPPKVARKLLLKIWGIVAPILDGVIEKNPDIEKLAEKKVGLNLLNGAFAASADRLSEADLDWAMNELADITNVHMGGDETPKLSRVFDAHFAGKIGIMFRWFAWGLQVQFADFSDMVAGAIDGLAPAKGSKSPTT